jgi:hypothetical protein
MMQKANASMMMGSSSWLEQFTEAFSVQAGKPECFATKFAFKGNFNALLPT